MSNIERLPLELISLIVKQVDQRDWYSCGLVNSQFHAVTNPLIWRCMHIDSKRSFNRLIEIMDAAPSATTSASTEYSPSLDAATPVTASTGTSPSVGSLIRHVHLDSFLTNEQFLTFMKHAPKVEDLLLENALKITDASVRQIPTLCPHVKYLNLSSSQITDQSLPELGQLTQLSKLVLQRCPGIPFNSLHSLAKTPLKTLLVNVCGVIRFGDDDDDDDDAYRDKINDGMLELFGHRTITQTVLDVTGFNHLTSLTLFHCPSRFAQQLLRTLVNTTPVIWPHMEKLVLNGFKTLSEENAIAFIRAHLQLATLVLETNNWTDHYLDAVGSVLPRIKILGVSGGLDITRGGLLNLIGSCASLELIFLKGCGFTTDNFPEIGDHWASDTPIDIDELETSLISRIRQRNNNEDTDDEFWEEWREHQLIQLEMTEDGESEYETDSDNDSVDTDDEFLEDWHERQLDSDYETANDSNSDNETANDNVSDNEADE